MTKTSLIVLLGFVSAAAVAGCADAQPYGPPPPPGAYAPGGWDIGRRIHWIQDRIVRGRDDGSLDRREFRRVQGELDSIKNEDRADRYRNGGVLDGPTRHNLEERLNHLNEQIHWIHEHDETRPW